MWSTGFGIHTNNDPKKACNFWHELIIPQEIALVYLLIVEGLTLGFRRGEERERGTSGRCSPSPANPCWGAGDRCRCLGLPVTACHHLRGRHPGDRMPPRAVGHGPWRLTRRRASGGRARGTTVPRTTARQHHAPRRVPGPVGARRCLLPCPPPAPAARTHTAQETPTLSWRRTRRYATMPRPCL